MFMLFSSLNSVVGIALVTNKCANAVTHELRRLDILTMANSS